MAEFNGLGYLYNRKNPHEEKAKLMAGMISPKDDPYGFNALSNVPLKLMLGYEMGKARKWDEERDVGVEQYLKSVMEGEKKKEDREAKTKAWGAVGEAIKTENPEYIRGVINSFKDVLEINPDTAVELVVNRPEAIDIQFKDDKTGGQRVVGIGKKTGRLYMPNLENPREPYQPATPEYLSQLGKPLEPFKPSKLEYDVGDEKITQVYDEPNRGPTYAVSPRWQPKEEMPEKTLERIRDEKRAEEEGKKLGGGGNGDKDFWGGVKELIGLKKKLSDIEKGVSPYGDMIPHENIDRAKATINGEIKQLGDYLSRIYPKQWENYIGQQGTGGQGEKPQGTGNQGGAGLQGDKTQIVEELRRRARAGDKDAQTGLRVNGLGW